MSEAVRLEGVSKRYGNKVAVSELDLTVPTGSIYGFIGPNGSGKTTTIRMILHIIHPDIGRVEVLGRTDTRSANDEIGYLPEERGLYRKMSVIRVLSYFGTIKGMSQRDARIEALDWLDKLGLAETANNKIEALSKGMAQKVQFIAATLARPKLMILDEPFSGLDPVNLDVVRDQILKLREAGTTVIFSTHDMAAAEALCDSVFMIYNGVKVLDGTLDTIKAQHGEAIVRVACAEGAEPARALAGSDGFRDLGRYQEIVSKRDPQDLLQELSASATVQHFEIKRPSLHDIFVRIAKIDAGDNGGETRE